VFIHLEGPHVTAVIAAAPPVGATAEVRPALLGGERLACKAAASQSQHEAILHGVSAPLRAA
jgi:hypothetical protein